MEARADRLTGDDVGCCPDDEALIIRGRTSGAKCWAVEFGSYLWGTMDYRYRLSSTNCYYAQLEDDGELILAISLDGLGGMPPVPRNDLAMGE